MDKARARYYWIGATEEMLVWEKGREEKEEEEEEGSSELLSSHGGLTRRLLREGRLFS